MTDNIPAQSRYFVRMGGKGWMVYDRVRKGPTLIGTAWAANLTKEQAEQILRSLTSSAAEKPLSATDRGPQFPISQIEREVLFSVHAYDVRALLGYRRQARPFRA